MTDTDILLRHDEDGLCTLTLNRPDKLNALDTALFMRLETELAKLEQQTETIGCVVIRGAGRSFCAGADLGAMQSGATPPPPTFKPGVIERLSRLPQPVVAAVQGNCFTGGLELALACDLILARDTARFADTHGKWGFVGGWGMSQRLPRRIGISQAKRMMMTARVIDAAEALRIGLIDGASQEDLFENELTALTGEILANSWFTNRETKRLLIETEGMRRAEGLAYEHYRHPGSAPDFRDRIAAFAKKP